MADADSAQHNSRPTVHAPYARGTQLGDNNKQINNNHHHHYYGPSGPGETQDEPADEAEGAPSGPSKSSLGGIALIVFLVAVGCYNLLSGSSQPKSSFPEENGQRPPGSSNQAVFDTTLDALRNCAKATVLQPLNCPQAIDDFYTDDAEQVSWRLHGEPGDGAMVVFNGQEGRFHVLGTAVMTVTYKDATGPRLRLRVVHYWSRVEWANNQPKLAEIRAYDDTPRPATDKRDPNIADDALFPLVEAAFRKCASTKLSPMPPECPTGKTTPQANRAEWKLNGNPLVNARATFDAPSGLIHVKGNYSATVAYKLWPTGMTSETESGTYDAVVSVDNGKPIVLRIQRE